MDKQEVFNIMIQKFNEENRSLALAGGDTEDQADQKIAAGMPAIRYLLDAVYEELKLKNIL